METNRAYYIFLKGYSKNCGFTLAEWLEAKEIVHRRREEVRRLKVNIDTSIK